MNDKKQNLLKKRSFLVYLIEARMSNSNGDPDNGNAPRTLPDGRGFITSMAIKSRQRYMLADHESVVFQDIINNCGLQGEEDDFNVFESRLKGWSVDTPREAVDETKKLFDGGKGTDDFLKRFWDTRVFGTTAIEEAKNKDNALNFTRTGCIQLTHPVSLHPVNIITQTITKKCPLVDKDIVKECGTMAPNGINVVEYGLYMGEATINPMDAHKTNTTTKDAEVFLAVFPHAMSVTTSCSRPSVRVVRAYYAEHSKSICSFNENDFRNACVPVLKEGVDDPKSLDDYEIKSAEDIGNELGINVVDLCK